MAVFQDGPPGWKAKLPLVAWKTQITFINATKQLTDFLEKKFSRVAVR